jgi:hypothetical protein
MQQQSHARPWAPAIILVAATILSAPLLRAQSTQPGSSSPIDPRERLRPSRFPGLPPTQPTSLPPSAAQVNGTPPPAGNALPAPIAATPVTNESPSRRARRAQVSYLDGQLDVRADDSSLNQILREISRRTGLKITGGVADQRVFGNYGPATTASVLATLLDGTGTNLLLLEGNASTPPELVLTPRGGGPTPPSPSSPVFDDAPDPAPVQTTIQQPLPQQQSTQQQTIQQQQPASGPPSIPQPLNNVNGSPLNTSPTASTFPTTNSVPTDTLPTPSTTPSTSGIVDAPNPPAPGSTTGTAPNGTATPEQVYQQLLKMQQQQQSPHPLPPTNNPQ